MPTNAKSYGTTRSNYGSGASGRRQYLRHNPTDWKERAMGGRKKVTIKNNVISRGDPTPTNIYPSYSDPARGSGTVPNQAKGTHINRIGQLRSKNYPFGDKKTKTSGASTGASTKGKWGAGSLLAVPGALATLKGVDMLTKKKTPPPKKGKNPPPKKDEKKKVVKKRKKPILKKVKEKITSVKKKIQKRSLKLQKKVTGSKTYKELDQKKRNFKKTTAGRQVRKLAVIGKKIAKKTPKGTFPTLLGGTALGAAASWYLKD